MKLNESQKDILGIIITLSLFWFVMSYFIATQPNYVTKQKTPQIEKKHVQSPALEKYGELITNNK